MAYIDHLTGAYSRQFLDIWDKSVRSYRENYALVVIDVDGFKEINDVHGQVESDIML
jgi:diguanylate cyclase (GGDEF)-like protein